MTEPRPVPPDPAAISTPTGAEPGVAELREELEAVQWLQQEVREGRRLPVAEADAVSHSLFAMLKHDAPDGLPQLPLHHMGEYLAVHAINVSLLAMVLGEFTGVEGGAVRELGMAALLHDIGMARVPVELLSKGGPLETEQRELMKRHAIDGARIIVEADAALDLAAVVAYEHHLRPDGSGYPTLAYARPSHFGSKLVQICDVYHALSSPRPFRKAWPADIVFSFIRDRAGFELDPELAVQFTQMLEQRIGTTE